MVPIELHKVRSEIPLKSPTLSWELLLYPPNPDVFVRVVMSVIECESPFASMTVSGMGAAEAGGMDAKSDAVEMSRIVIKQAVNMRLASMWFSPFSVWNSRLAHKNISGYAMLPPTIKNADSCGARANGIKGKTMLPLSTHRENST